MYERDSYSKVVESGEECNKGGGNRECSTRDHSSKTTERERERETGWAGNTKGGEYEQIHVEIYKESITDQRLGK